LPKARHGATFQVAVINGTFHGVVQGYGATAGDALVRHHDVRAVSFTGGTATGRNAVQRSPLIEKMVNSAASNARSISASSKISTGDLPRGRSDRSEYPGRGAD
jgi:acyl-CoA reductase-like NAD-dependent aldehyde dehydrogenase